MLSVCFLTNNTILSVSVYVWNNAGECCNFSLGIKVPTIIEEAKSSLEAGFCVVIGLQTTGEVSDLVIYYNWTSFTLFYGNWNT